MGIFDKFNKMKTNYFKVIAFKSVNWIEFGISRDEVWNVLDKPKKLFKKTQFDMVDTDDYVRFYVYYDENYNFEYIEIFDDEYQFEKCGNFDIYYNNDKLPKKYSEVLKYFESLYDDIEEDGSGFISKKGSITINIENDDDTIDAIGFCKKDLFK